MSQLFARKPIAELQPDSEGPHALKRVLGAGDLIMLAIGAVIGAGIFGAIGTAAAGQVAMKKPGAPTLARKYLPVSPPQSNGPSAVAGPFAWPWCHGPSTRWALGLAFTALNTAGAP